MTIVEEIDRIGVEVIRAAHSGGCVVAGNPPQPPDELVSQWIRLNFTGATAAASCK